MKINERQEVYNNNEMTNFSIYVYNICWEFQIFAFYTDLIKKIIDEHIIRWSI